MIPNTDSDWENVSYYCIELSIGQLFIARLSCPEDTEHSSVFMGRSTYILIYFNPFKLNPSYAEATFV